MQLSDLPKITTSSKKRVGRGHGSGKGGHTSGRGHKGEKSRNKIDLFFEGTKFKKSLIKRLPLVRGKGKFKPQKDKPLIVNVKYLNLFKDNEEVTFESLKEKGIIAKDILPQTPIKILGEGELKVSLKVYLPTSQNARKKIEAAGGQVLSPKNTLPKAQNNQNNSSEERIKNQSKINKVGNHKKITIKKNA